MSLPFILVFFVGITLGLFGGGGTILLLPLLVYLFSIDLGQAIPIAQLTLFSRASPPLFRPQGVVRSMHASRSHSGLQASSSQRSARSSVR